MPSGRRVALYLLQCSLTWEEREVILSSSSSHYWSDHVKEELVKPDANDDHMSTLEQYEKLDDKDEVKLELVIDDGREELFIDDDIEEQFIDDGIEEQLIDDDMEEQLMDDGIEEQFINDGKEEQLINDGKVEQFFDDGKVEQFINDGKEEQFIDDGEEEQLVDDGIEEQLVDDGKEEQLVDEGKEEQLVDDGKEEQLVDDGIEEQLVIDGEEEQLVVDGEEERFDDHDKENKHLNLVGVSNANHFVDSSDSVVDGVENTSPLISNSPMIIWITDTDLVLNQKQKKVEIFHNITSSLSKQTSSLSKQTSSLCKQTSSLSKRSRDCTAYKTVSFSKSSFDDEFECKICNLKFASGQNFSKHMTMHEKKCKICYKVFQCNFDFIRHKRIHLNNISNLIGGGALITLGFSQPKKQDSGGVEEMLTKTISRSTRGKEVSDNAINSTGSLTTLQNLGEIPQKEKGNQIELQHRNKMMENDKPIDPTMQVCSCKSKRLSQEVAQGHQHHIVPLHKCVHCGAPYESTTHLKSQIRRRHRPKYRCPMCPKTVSSPHYLKQHLWVHSKEVPVYAKCTHCPARFQSATGLTSHTRQKHKAKCPFCPKVVSSLRYLRQHMQVHEKESLECSHCGEVFESTARLKCHIEQGHPTKKRDSVRPKTISIPLSRLCKASDVSVVLTDLLKNGSTLVRRIGSGVTSVSMDRCISDCHKPENTCSKQLEQVRTDVGLYRCEDCSSKFHDRTALRRHVLSVHRSASVKYACTVCQQLFAFETVWSAHVAHCRPKERKGAR